VITQYKHQAMIAQYKHPAMITQYKHPAMITQYEHPAVITHQLHCAWDATTQGSQVSKPVDPLDLISNLNLGSSS